MGKQRKKISDWRRDSNCDASGKVYVGTVPLYQHTHSGGPWPSDIAAHHDAIDIERGITPPKLCRDKE